MGRAAKRQHFASSLLRCPSCADLRRCRGQKSGLPALRLAAPYVARLVVEEGADGEPAAVVHHAMANSRLAHAEFPPGVANGGAR